MSARGRPGRQGLAGWSTLPVLLTFAVAALAASPLAIESATKPPAGAELRLPRTIDRVWYRKGTKRALGGASISGDLTVTSEGLELTGRKKTLVIPLGSLRQVSFGKMRGDVDTDWVVLAVERDGEEELVGLRDGKRLGYGERTRGIYELLRRTVRSFAAAQYAVPSGWRTYDELDHQLTLSLPQGWFSAHESVVTVDGLPLWGTTVFSAQPIPAGSEDPAGRRRAFEAVSAGTTAAVILGRRETSRGMRCTGFSDAARRTVEQRLRALGARTQQAPWELGDLELGAQSLDGCSGLRLVGRGRRADGAEVVLDARAIAAEGSLFMLALRSEAEHYERRVHDFDRTVASFRRMVARGGP